MRKSSGLCERVMRVHFTSLKWFSEVEKHKQIPAFQTCPDFLQRAFPSVRDRGRERTERERRSWRCSEGSYRTIDWPKSGFMFRFVTFCPTFHLALKDFFSLGNHIENILVIIKKRSKFCVQILRSGWNPKNLSLAMKKYNQCIYLSLFNCFN